MSTPSAGVGQNAAKQEVATSEVNCDKSASAAPQAPKRRGRPPHPQVLSSEEMAARYEHERERRRERGLRAQEKAAAQLAEAKTKVVAGSPAEVPDFYASRREVATRYYYEKVRPKRLAEQAQKGSLSAQWELEHHAEKTAWLLERAGKVAANEKAAAPAAEVPAAPTAAAPTVAAPAAEVAAAEVAAAEVASCARGRGARGRGARGRGARGRGARGRGARGRGADGEVGKS